MKKLFLIDGNAILHRAYHAMPLFKTTKGELVNAVYGFSSMLLNIINTQKPEYIAVSFDRKAPTIRHEEYKEYKATRVKAPDDLYGQLPRIKQIVETFNMPIFEMDRYEADDILGTLARQVEELNDGRSTSPLGGQSDDQCNGQPDVGHSSDGQSSNQSDDRIHTFIVTGDMDTLQLISPSTFVFAPQHGVLDYIIYDDAKVLSKYGLTPSQIVDFKALKGDASDNIPGVMGIGEKTAVDLLQKYKTLEGIYANLSEVRDTVRAKLEKDRESAFFSQHLATIMRDVPIELDIEKCRTHDFELDRIIHLFEELEFKSLIGKITKFNNHYSPIRKVEDSGQPSLF